MADNLELHGPMWQFECHICHFIGDCWNTESDAKKEMLTHNCLDQLPEWARTEINDLLTEVADLQKSAEHWMTEASHYSSMYTANEGSHYG